ncbi:MAG: AtpZ/AtpI family protein [Firmicutes bacterium]|nr:AtpZ/AtpI family protein [Bacillota bacterium]
MVILSEVKTWCVKYHYVFFARRRYLSKNQNKDKKVINSEALRALVHVSQIGITMAASVLTGVLLGRYLDGLLGTTPWLLLLFSLSGVGAALKSLLDLTKT